MLTSERARAKLDDIKEGWLALACHHGEPFLDKAASILLSGVPHDPRLGWWIRGELLRSAMARGDAEGCRMFINDWSNQPRYRPGAKVTKFVPGEHYHCLGTKFDNLDDAKFHLRTRGYEFGGLEEKHVYPNVGD